METPLTPLEFARRARRLYADREAVVDGSRRFTYEAFFRRCDRWAAALQALGVARGDRVAYIASNTTRQLESFYAVPSIGAVLVPINFRLTAADFAYIINHSGATVVCVDPEYAPLVDSVRAELQGVRHFVTLDDRAAAPGWRPYDALLVEAPDTFTPADVTERDLLTINYTSGTTSRPKGVMITHRNAYMNTVGTLVHIPMTCADSYLWTLPMFHANGWTFTWTVTAAGEGCHVCLPKYRIHGAYSSSFATSASRSCAWRRCRHQPRQRARRGQARGPVRRQGHCRRCSPGRCHHPAD